MNANGLSVYHFELLLSCILLPVGRMTKLSAFLENILFTQTLLSFQQQSLFTSEMTFTAQSLTGSKINWNGRAKTMVEVYSENVLSDKIIYPFEKGEFFPDDSGRSFPFTGQTLGILCLGLLYGRKLGLATILSYITLGSLGMPLFAKGGSGILFFSPSGGLSDWLCIFRADLRLFCGKGLDPVSGKTVCGNIVR